MDRELYVEKLTIHYEELYVHHQDVARLSGWTPAFGRASATESGSRGPLGEAVDKPPRRAGQGPLVGGAFLLRYRTADGSAGRGLLRPGRHARLLTHVRAWLGPRPAPAQVARSTAARAGRSGLLVDGREGSSKRVGDVEQIVWIALAPRHVVGLAVLLVEGGHDLL